MDTTLLKLQRKRNDMSGENVEILTEIVAKICSLSARPYNESNCEPDHEHQIARMAEFCIYLVEHFSGNNEEVPIFDDPTSFEGLVNRCKKAKACIARRRVLQSSRPANSLGLRAQSFKKAGYSSSSSGSCGIFRFGRKREGQCDHCGRKHTSDQCRMNSGACYLCGDMGHLQRDCPSRGGFGRGSQASVHHRTPAAPIGSSNLRPRAQGHVFSLTRIRLRRRENV